MVADPDHVDLALKIEEYAAHSQGTAPLPGSSLSSQAFNPLFLIVVSLSNSGVRLVTARLAGSLVFVENLGWCIQSLL